MALACFCLGKNPVVSCLAIASIRTFIVKPQTAELAICARWRANAFSVLEASFEQDLRSLDF